MPDRRAIAAFLLAGTLLLGLPAPLPAQQTCTVTGTGGNDVLQGTQGADVICGLEGDDVIEALAGDDIVYGGAGEDVVDGGAGTDILFGGPGVDTLSGEDGADYLDGGVDQATMDGGRGADACRFGTAVSCYLPGIDDKNDTPGRADVRRVRSFAEQDRPRWKIKTFATWTPKGMWDAGYFVVFIDTLGDARPDYHVLAYSTGTKLGGGLYEATAGGGESRIGPAPVKKSGARGATVTVPLDELQRSRPYFRWNVVTLFTGKGCQKVCFDRVPGPAMLPQAVLADL
jgi:RTX calcium-binding nonapeptide repeat (4 copies)